MLVLGHLKRDSLIGTSAKGGLSSPKEVDPGQHDASDLPYCTDRGSRTEAGPDSRHRIASIGPSIRTRSMQDISVLDVSQLPAAGTKDELAMHIIERFFSASVPDSPLPA